MTPCKADPAAFALEGSATPAELIEACMYCPLLASCRADFTADPDGHHGVIAGLYRPWPVSTHEDARVSEGKWAQVINYLLDFCDTAEPGTLVPPSRQLAEASGVNRWISTAALQEIEARGLITPSARVGRSKCRYTRPIPGTELEQEAEAS